MKVLDQYYYLYFNIYFTSGWKSCYFVFNDEKNHFNVYPDQQLINEVIQLFDNFLKARGYDVKFEMKSIPGYDYDVLMIADEDDLKKFNNAFSGEKFINLWKTDKMDEEVVCRLKEGMILTDSLLILDINGTQLFTNELSKKEICPECGNTKQVVLFNLVHPCKTCGE